MKEGKVGDIAVCSLGCYGLLMYDGKQEIEYPDGTKSEAYIGIHLETKMIDGREILMGSEWCSRNPKFVGNISEALDSLESMRYLDGLTEKDNLPFYTLGKTTGLNKDTDTLGMPLNQLAYILSEWGKNQDFDTPTSLKTREDRILMNEKLMLIVTEVSEVCESLRKLDYKHAEEELADIIIRTLNICGSLGIDIDKRVSDKMKKNRNRPKKHGKDC